jgi:hypothetical protein
MWFVVYVLLVVLCSRTMVSLGLELSDPEWWIIIGSVIFSRISGLMERKW